MVKGFLFVNNATIDTFKQKKGHWITAKKEAHMFISMLDVLMTLITKGFNITKDSFIIKVAMKKSQLNLDDIEYGIVSSKEYRIVDTIYLFDIIKELEEALKPYFQNENREDIDIDKSNEALKKICSLISERGTIEINRE